MTGCFLHSLLLGNIFVKKTDFHSDLSDGWLKGWSAESGRAVVCETAKSCWRKSSAGKIGEEKVLGSVLGSS